MKYDFLTEFAYAGSKAIIYKLVVNNTGSTENPSIPSDIKICYQASTDQNPTYSSNIVGDNNGSENDIVYPAINSPGIYYILIKNLQPDTEYSVWALYNGEEHDNTTVTTEELKNSNTVVEFIFDEDYNPSTEIRTEINSLNTILDELLKNILRTELLKDTSYKLDSSVDAYYILGNLSEEFNEEQSIHRALKKYILKDFMKQWDNYHEDKKLINLFMEFATNVPKASWKWIEDDCYPITTNNNADWSHIALMIAAISISNLADDYE